MAESLQDIWTHIYDNPLSTLQSLLSVSIALGVYFTAVPSGVLSQHTIGIITVVTGAGKVILGVIQKD